VTGVAALQVEAVYFQCARAILRSDLWNPALHVDEATLPSVGAIVADLSDCRMGGEPYDREWPERSRATLW